MNRLIVFSFFLFSFYFSPSQEYVQNIEGDILVEVILDSKIKSKSAQLYLYELLGNDQYILDSLKVVDGNFVFEKQTYYTGVYRICLNNSTNALDFIINPAELKDNKITIEIKNYRIKEGYSIPNSLDNKIKKLYSIKEQAINSRIKLIRKSQKARDQKIQEMKDLQNELFEYGLSLDNQYPGTYYGMIISKMQSPYQSIQHRYFSDINFNDECILRSSLLPTRIQTYIQNFNNIKTNKYGFHDAVDVVMEYAKENEKVAEFCMYNMLDGFYNTGQTQRKNEPIWEDLCNYIMDEYIFGEGCGDSVSPSLLLQERASHFKNLQIGNIPPNISTKDIKGNLVNLKNTCLNNKYTILMFWASHCTHCMTELPGFANWYNKNSKNLNIEVVAVSLDGQKKKWENTVTDNNFNWTNICQFKVYKSPICLDFKIKKTPTIFVLNNQMEIVAKPKSTNQLRSFLSSNR